MRRADLFSNSDQRSMHRKVLTHSSDAPETLARAPHHTHQQDAQQAQQCAQRRAYADRRSSSHPANRPHHLSVGKLKATWTCQAHISDASRSETACTCVQPDALKDPVRAVSKYHISAHLIASQAHQRRSTFWINRLAKSVPHIGSRNVHRCCPDRRGNPGFSLLTDSQSVRWHWANPPPGQSWRWVPPTGRRLKWKYSA